MRINPARAGRNHDMLVNCRHFAPKQRHRRSNSASFQQSIHLIRVFGTTWPWLLALDSFLLAQPFAFYLSPFTSLGSKIGLLIDHFVNRRLWGKRFMRFFGNHISGQLKAHCFGNVSRRSADPYLIFTGISYPF